MRTRTWFQVRFCIYFNLIFSFDFNLTLCISQREYKQIIFSFESFREQPVCPVKDVYHDLQDAIEYMETKEPPTMDSQPDKVATLSDFFSIDSRYYT